MPRDAGRVQTRSRCGMRRLPRFPEGDTFVELPTKATSVYVGLGRD